MKKKKIEIFKKLRVICSNQKKTTRTNSKNQYYVLGKASNRNSYLYF